MRVWQAFDMEETNDDLSLVLRLKNSAGESLKSRSLVKIKPGASFCYNKLFQFFFYLERYIGERNFYFI